MKKTVFVVGAGASTDFSMPLGSELVEMIRRKLFHDISDPKIDGIISVAMRSQMPGDFGEAAREVAGGMTSARSIDRFLESRKDRPLTVFLGKCAASYCLLTAEGNSRLKEDPDETWETIHGKLTSYRSSWLSSMFSILHEGVHPNKSSDIFKNASFITFNYDRCIERFLQMSFQHVMNLDRNESDHIVREIPIIHVYGSLGDLPSSGSTGLPFGASIDHTLDAAARLKTFTEGTFEGAIEKCHALLDEADQIVFLGFAFDPMNVKALFPSYLRNDQSIFGTKFRVALPEMTNFQDAVGRGYHSLTDERCNEYCISTQFRSVCLS
jgi:hypothetical protein